MGRSGFTVLAVAVLSTPILVSCGDDASSRTDVVASIVVDVPSRYETFESAAGELDARVESWCADGDRGAVLEAVDAARAAWVSVSPFWFGPVMERRSRFIIDPTVAEDDVAAILDGDEAIDALALRNLYGADQRGLGAVEVLVAGTDASVPSDRRCAYARAASGLVAEEASELAAAWTATAPDLATDEASASDAIEAMVNEILFGVVTLANDPDVGSAMAKLEGMRWALLGQPAASFGNVAGLGPLLDDEVVAQLQIEFDAATDLDGDAVRALEVTITTNVVGSLGLSVQFSDADGDG